MTSKIPSNRKRSMGYKIARAESYMPALFEKPDIKQGDVIMTAVAKKGNWKNHRHKRDAKRIRKFLNREIPTKTYHLLIDLLLEDKLTRERIKRKLIAAEL